MIVDYDRIQKMIESNLEVRISNESVNSSKAKVTSLGTSFIPEVSLYAQGESDEISRISKEPTSGVYANINLFNGFRDTEQIKVNTLAYESTKLESKKTYN